MAGEKDPREYLANCIFQAMAKRNVFIPIRVRDQAREIAGEVISALNRVAGSRLKVIQTTDKSISLELLKRRASDHHWRNVEIIQITKPEWELLMLEGLVEFVMSPGSPVATFMGLRIEKVEPEGGFITEP